MWKILLSCMLLIILHIECALIQFGGVSSGPSTYEALYRNFITSQNRVKIQSINKKKNSFTLSANVFISLTASQFNQSYLATFVPNQQSTIFSSITNPIIQQKNINVTYVNIDWTAGGMVTAVKNQGGCGGCWAFSTVSDLQSSYLLSGASKDIDLSEQQLIDCAGGFFNYGCLGGWMTNAFAYIYKHPLTTEKLYPYVARANTCNNVTGAFKLKNLRSYWKSQSCQLLQVILQTRPVAVAVSADPLYWAFYSSGILNQCSGQINHGVTLVGITRSANENYYLIKNSWGTLWGINGYIKLDSSSNNPNLCHICEYPQYSII